MPVCTHGCGGQRSTWGIIPQSTPTFYFVRGSESWSLTSRLSWLDRKQELPCLAFHVGSGNQIRSSFLQDKHPTNSAPTVAQTAGFFIAAFVVCAFKCTGRGQQSFMSSSFTSVSGRSRHVTYILSVFIRYFWFETSFPVIFHTQLCTNVQREAKTNSLTDPMCRARFKFMVPTMKCTTPLQSHPRYKD